MTRLVLGSYLVLAAAPFIVAATTAAFWRHATVPTATVLFAALLLSLARRHRWVWVVLVVLDGSALIASAFDFRNVLWFIVQLASFALLISPPMRRYVRPQQHLSPRAQATVRRLPPVH